MSIIAIIPARGGSKGVPQKNIKLLAGFPLIAYSIICGLMSKKIDRVIVSTDSQQIAELAKSFGAEVPFLRPAKYATDESPDIDFVLHSINWLKKNEKKVPEYFVHLRPTTPLRNPQIVDTAVAEIVSNDEATSLRSGHIASESPFKWFLKNEEGYFKSILSGYSTDDCNSPRQDFPAVYIPDGYVDVLKTEYIIKSGKLHGEKMIGFVSPFCTEVDTLEDFEILAYEIKKKGSELLKYLKKNFAEGIK